LETTSGGTIRIDRETAGDDAFIFAWTDHARILHLRSGDDIVVDKSFADDQVFGGAGDDIIVSTAGHDTLRGNSGDDHITVQPNQYVVAVMGDTGTEYEYHGYSVEVRGGIGHDVLTIEHSSGYSMTTDHRGRVHIDTPLDEHIIARGIEEFQFI